MCQEVKPAYFVDEKWIKEQDVKVKKRPLASPDRPGQMAKSDSWAMTNGRSLHENVAKSQSQEVTISDEIT